MPDFDQPDKATGSILIGNGFTGGSQLLVNGTAEGNSIDRLGRNSYINW
jgi:hypothetical protein